MERIEGDRDTTSTALENSSIGEAPMNTACSPNREDESRKDLLASLEKLLQEATSCADMWKNVNMKFNDRRCFPRFLQLLQTSGLDWHKYTLNEVQDYNQLDVDSQPNRWSAPSYPKLASDSNWVMANKYYARSLSLMKRLKRIRSESSNAFSREQAGLLLASFLDHLIMILQEQRDVAYGFSEHLEQLRTSAAAPLPSLEAAELGNVSGDISSFLGGACAKAVEETLELIEEAIQKLNSVRFSNHSSGGSTLEDITCWKVLFESSLVNLRLELICKKHSEAIKHGVNTHSVNRLHGEIRSLLSAGDKLLLDYVAMHRTTAEITYMLGDAFTTGGAGPDALNDLSCENDKIIEMDFDPDLDFPWDKHTVLDEVKVDLNDPRWLRYRSVEYGPDPDSDTEFI